MDIEKKDTNNTTVNDMIEKARRKSTSEEMLQHLTEKFPIDKCAILDGHPMIPVEFVKNFTFTQMTMLMSALIFYTIDWEKKEYYAIDLKYGEEYHNEIKGKKKSKKS